jgi:hypothetical protein
MECAGTVRPNLSFSGDPRGRTSRLMNLLLKLESKIDLTQRLALR